MLAPIYRGRKSRFIIDSCAPQCAAARRGKIQLHALSKGHYPGKILKPSRLPGINSIGFWDAAGGQDWGLDPHRNEGVEICFLETGGMPFSVEAKNFELCAGQFTLTRPWQLHKLGRPNIGPGKLHWLILDVGVRRPNQDWRWPDWVTLTGPDKMLLTRKLRHNDAAVWNASQGMTDAFRGLSQSLQKWGNPHIESRMIVLLNLLLVEILATLTRQHAHEDPKLVSRRYTVKLFLQDLAANRASSSQPWTLREMASECGMGITALSKYCRELVNNGPVDYLNHCRLEHAAKQLGENPAQSITEIAFNNGFSSSQYFATAFRRKFNRTPGGHRKLLNLKSIRSKEVRDSLRSWLAGPRGS